MSTPAQYLGTGKRKTSVARVILRPGDGKTWINGKSIEEYFPRQVHPARDRAVEDGRARGPVRPPRPPARRRPVGPGRRDASRHRPRARRGQPRVPRPAEAAGFLTRDARSVERKKAGLHKARKAPQFSKR